MFQGKRNRQTLRQLYLTYTVIFVMIILLMYGIFFWTNKTLIWTGDGLAQHFPVLAEFRKMLIAAITPETQSGAWSWKLGLGADVLTTFSYYVCGDVFAYLIPLFGASHIELGYSVLLLLRLYFVGASFLYFAQHFRFKRTSLLIGTIIYQFSGMALYISIRHPFFLIPMIILPILCLGIEKVLQQNSSWLLIIATAWALLSNFYFAYMLAIFGLGYAVIRYLGHYRQRPLLPILARLIIAILIGTLVASVLLIPTLLAFLDSSRNQASFANGLWAYPLSYYLKLPANLIDPSLDSNANYWTQLGIIGLNLLGIVYTGTHWRQHRATVIGLVLAFVAMLVPAIGAISNGFTSPSNRWLILAALITAIATMHLADHWTTLASFEIRQLAYWTFAFIALVYLANGLSFGQRSSYQAFIWLLGTLGFLIALPKLTKFSERQLNLSLVLLSSLNLITVGINFFSPNGYNGSGQLVQSGATKSMVAGYFDGVDTRSDLPKLTTGARANTLYNYYPYKQSQSNLSLLTKQPLLGSYFSLQSSSTKQLADDIQLAQSTMNAPLQQLDNRTTINQLLGVQRLFVGSNQTKQVPGDYQPVKARQNGTMLPIANGNQMIPQIDNQQGTSLYSTSNAAPLAWFQSKTISLKTYRSLSAVDREQALSQATVVSKAGSTAQSSMAQAHSLTYTASPNPQDLLITPAAIQTAINNQPVTSRQIESDPSKATKYTRSQQTLVNRLIAQAVAIDDQTTGQNLTKLQRDLLGRQISVNLAIDHPEQTRNKEIYLQLEDVHYQDTSTRQQRQHSINARLLENRQLPVFTKFQNWRNDLQYSPDRGYELWATADDQDQTQTTVAYQEAKSVLSSYTKKNNWTIDLGTSASARDTVRLGMKYANQISFKSAKILAVPLGRQHQEEMQLLQQNRLRNLRLTPDQVAGSLDTNKAGVITTTIPYSSGWHATINGHPVRTQKVDDAFVGVAIPAGQHKVQFHYQTPGLFIGKLLSLIGIVLLPIWLIWEKHRLQRN